MVVERHLLELVDGVAVDVGARHADGDGRARPLYVVGDVQGHIDGDLSVRFFVGGRLFGCLLLLAYEPVRSVSDARHEPHGQQKDEGARVPALLAWLLAWVEVDGAVAARGVLRHALARFGAGGAADIDGSDVAGLGLHGAIDRLVAHRALGAGKGQPAMQAGLLQRRVVVSAAGALHLGRPSAS